MPGKALYLTVGEGHKLIALEEVENALAQQIHDDADVPSVIKAITEVDTSIPILRVIRFQGSEHPQLDSRSIPIFLDGADDLDGHQLVLPPIGCLDDLAKGTLTEEFDNLVWQMLDDAFFKGHANTQGK